MDKRMSIVDRLRERARCKYEADLEKGNTDMSRGRKIRLTNTAAELAMQDTPTELEALATLVEIGEKIVDFGCWYNTEYGTCCVFCDAPIYDKFSKIKPDLHNETCLLKELEQALSCLEQGDDDVT